LVRTVFSLPAHPPTGNIHAFAAALAAAVHLHKLPVVHLPQVLYHQRHSAHDNPATAPANPERQAAMQWLANTMVPGTKVSANPLYPALLRTEWPLPEKLPRVSLIVP